MSMPRRKVEIPIRERELCTAGELGTLLNMGRTQFAKFRKSGRLLNPIESFDAPRWRVREVLAWVDAGCPDVSDWKWPRAVTMELERYRALLSQQLVQIQDGISAAAAAEKAGATMVEIRRGS